MNLVIRLGNKGSRFINKHLDIFIPPVTEFNHKILSENFISDDSLRDDIFTVAFVTKLMELTEAGKKEIVENVENF